MYKTAEAIKLAGGKVTREPGPVPGIKTKITACVDPDGWKTVCLYGHFQHYFQHVVTFISGNELFVTDLFSTPLMYQVFVDNVDFHKELD